jgi:hypothetical protein
MTDLSVFGAPDPTREQVTYELKMRMRRRFVSENTGHCLPIGPFVMSLESGRYDDCVKDIERGRVTLGEAERLLAEAVRYKLFTDAQALNFLEKWRAADARREVAR